MRSAPSHLPADYHQPGYESLDLEDAENTVYRSDRAASTPLRAMAHASLKWGVCLLIGGRLGGKGAVLGCQESLD